MTSFDTFEHPPLDYLRGADLEAAKADLADYYRGSTGSWYERLADSDQPDVITVRDIVAVSTLGVDIPEAVTIWVLDEGAAQITEHLRAIPVDQEIWDPDADITPDGPASKLWSILRKVAGWPEHRGGMGKTKTSKLLATKRPHLIPINDSRTEALLYPKHHRTNTWSAWRHEFTTNRAELDDIVAQLHRHEPQSADLSALRTLDIVLWMRSHRHDVLPADTNA